VSLDGRIPRRLGRGAVLILALAIATTLSLDLNRGTATAARTVITPQHLGAANTPALPIAAVHTAGTYPVVQGGGRRASIVNSAVRAAVLEDERRFGRIVGKVDPRTAPGLYETRPAKRFISASSVVFSALVPTITLRPGGNDGEWWLAVTVIVESGRRTNLEALLSRPRTGLEALARLARTQLVRRNRCVRNSLSVDGRFYRPGFAPRAANYRYFALLPEGLAVGFPTGQVASPACGRTYVTLSYRVIDRFLSPLGRQLVQGVRLPIG
jgi:hypothetical protein